MSVDCFVDLSLLVDIAAIRESYKTPLTEGFVFGEGGHLKSALAWPITSLSHMTSDAIIKRIGHVCMTRKDLDCVGVWQLYGNNGLELKQPCLENVPSQLKVYLQINVEIFEVLDAQTDPCTTLELIKRLNDEQHPQLRQYILVYDASNQQPIPWTLKADYPSFILYESLFNLDKLHSNIATTLPTFSDDRTSYSDLEIRRLVDVVSNHQSKANQLFLKQALEHVKQTHETVEQSGDLLTNENIDPVLLRQIQFATSELAALKEKQNSEETQCLLRVLDKALTLTQLSYSGSQRLFQMYSDKKYKVAKAPSQRIPPITDSPLNLASPINFEIQPF